MKVFNLLNGQNSLTINEAWHVSQAPNWTDWDEEIFMGGPGGWQWLTNPAPICQFSGNGQGQPDLVGTVDNVLGRDLVFNFTQPEVPSTVITITKTLQWTGAGKTHPIRSTCLPLADRIRARAWPHLPAVGHRDCRGSAFWCPRESLPRAGHGIRFCRRGHNSQDRRQRADGKDRPVLLRPPWAG